MGKADEGEALAAPLVPSQPPTHSGCCSSRLLVLLTGLSSVLASLVVLLPALYALLSPPAWTFVKKAAHNWLEQNHWDIQVTKVVWKGFNWVDDNHRMLLAVVIGCTVIHLFFCLMLILGGILRNRVLFIPWLMSDMIIILIMIVSFTCWTFMSFFVDLLVAIVFPVLGGLVLGVTIYLWRRMQGVFVEWGMRDRGKIVIRQAGYKQVPNTKKEEEKSLERGVRRPHRQLMVVAENS